MSDKNFVSFLVDETLKLQKSGEMELSSLEHKLDDYELHYLKGEFITQTQVLRFQTVFGCLDIPINWPLFSVDNTQTDFTLLDELNDVDCFFKVIKSAWNFAFDKLLITHADGFCYIIGLDVGDETHLHDLLNPQEWLKSAA